MRDLAPREAQHAGDPGEREGPGLAVHRLEIAASRLLGVRRQPQLENQLVGQKHGLRAPLRQRSCEEIGELDRALAAAPMHPQRGVEREQRRGQVRGMHRVAGSTAQDGVIAILAIARGTVGTALQPAVDARVAVVPAARPLQQIAADRGEVANLGTRRQRRRLRERAVARGDYWMLLDFRERGERADLEALRPRFDAARQQHLHVHQPLGGGDVGFHQREQVRPARQSPRARAERADRLLDGARRRVFERPHRMSFSRVMGSSRMRTPVAL